MALDLTTVKQNGLAYDSAVSLTIPAGTTSTALPVSMKAFKISPTTNTALVLNFQNGAMNLAIDATADDGKIIPFRPISITVSADLDIEMLF